MCGVTIADKAIVCYKCGAPAIETAPVPRTVRARPRRWVRVPVVLAIVALAVWLVPQTPDGTWMRWAAWAAVPIVTLIAMRLVSGRLPRS